MPTLAKTQYAQSKKPKPLVDVSDPKIQQAGADNAAEAAKNKSARDADNKKRNRMRRERGVSKIPE